MTHAIEHLPAVAAAGQDGLAKDWDSYNARVDPRKNSPDWALFREARASHYREFFHIAPGDKVLDAGCGHGEYTVWALRDGACVWAFDYGQRSVDYTRWITGQEGARPEEVTRQSITDIAYPNHHFDVVFALGVLHHLSDDDRAAGLRECVRVLRPGGQLYLSVATAYGLHWRAGVAIMKALGMYPHGGIHYYTPRELRADVHRTGCEPVASLGMTFVPPFSGIYTSDLRRCTILPELLVRPLDRAYLAIERFARRHWPLRPLCRHDFLKAVRVSS